MRAIICSLKNNNDLLLLSDKLGCKGKLTNDISEIDFINKIIKRHEIEIKEYAKIKLVFDDNVTNKELSKIFDQDIDSNTIEIWFPKISYNTRSIICRFGNKEDMDKLYDKFDIPIKDRRLIEEYNIDTKEIKYRKTIKQPTKPKNLDWKNEWKQMIDFNIDFAEEEYCKCEFIFDSNYSLSKLKEYFEQNITNKTKSIWFPKLVQGKHRKIRAIGGRNPKYPIYVVSKGRYDFKGNTSNHLSRMGVKHYIVVEPQEVDLYKEYMDLNYCTVLELDMEYKNKYDVFDDDIGKGNGLGPGASRNFVKDHSTNLGFKWHWVLDDNIENFDFFWRGHKIYSHSPEIFSQVEDFVDRYENIGQAGLNYSKFCKGLDRVPPYVLNTRIYSFILNRNDLPYEWRGRYNEDTDLSLRILKDGYCTVQFNACLSAKLTTQKVKGGNTEEFYKKDGTYYKSLMLEKMHPDVAKVVWKFNRWHHEVDYSGFTQKLKIKEEYKNLEEGINNNGMIMVVIPSEWIGTNKDCSQYISEHLDECKRVDNTDMFL